MSRAERWWRPAPRRNVRPAVRAVRRVRPATIEDAAELYDTGYATGYADGLERTRKRDEQITRLARAADAAADGDPSLLDEIAQEHAGDDPLFRIEMAEARERDGLADGDLLDVADAAGVTPLPEVDGGQLAADVERWLREQGGQR